MTITKRDIVCRVAERAAMTQAQTQDVVQLTLEALGEAILSEGRLELRNFGVFEVKERAARKARDPRTGETMDVPARKVIAFRASPALLDQLEAL